MMDGAETRTKKQMERPIISKKDINTKIIPEKFGSIRKKPYLCTAIKKCYKTTRCVSSVG